MSGVCDCSWKPESIRVSAGNGKTEIDLVGRLKDKTYEYAALMGNQRRLEFPRDEYPPNEESKDLIVRSITAAAAMVDIHLIVLASKTKQGARPRCITLACDQSRAYRPSKSATTIQKNVYKETGDNTKPGSFHVTERLDRPVEF